MDTGTRLPVIEKMSSNPVIWEPDAARVRASAMYQFMRQNNCDDYAELHQWSLDEAPEFWSAICDFCDIQFDRPPKSILSRPDNIMDAGWFDGAQLNFAAHLLRHTGNEAAIVFCGEDGSRRELARDELRITVCCSIAESE